MALTQHDKATVFRALHEGEPFLIPNPWDAGSARVLAALGFQALATTSSGFAFTLGRLDGERRRSTRLSRTRPRSTRATELPVSVDLENGYGAEPEQAAAAIARVAAAGAVGGSIEDWDADAGLYEHEPGGRAGRGGGRGGARRSTSRSRSPPGPRTTSAATPTSTTRSPRLQAYEAAGRGRPLRAGPAHRRRDPRRLRGGLEAGERARAAGARRFAEVYEAGAQRVSVGGALAWVAVQALADAAERAPRRRRLLGARRAGAARATGSARPPTAPFTGSSPRGAANRTWRRLVPARSREGRACESRRR